MADAYRARGVPVVAGGPHASYWEEEALQHADAVVTGEADAIWPEVLRDLERGTLGRVYRGAPATMVGLPTPRYDLLEPRFLVPRVLQARRAGARSPAPSARCRTSTPASACAPSTTCSAT